MIVTRPITNSEPDLLAGHETKTLIVKTLNGETVKEIEPEQVWTHDSLEAVDFDTYSPFGWDAYLEDNWIGSSEL